MEEKITRLLQEVRKQKITKREEAEQFKLRFLSKKGEIALLFEEFKTLPSDQRKKIGKHLNELKQKTQNCLSEWKNTDPIKKDSTGSPPDLTLPVIPHQVGSRHPLTLTRERMTRIFTHMGFSVEDGPEIDDDHHNFSALNFPPNHPARDMQDTFFISQDPDILLRTHTSNVQIRLMKKQPPPIRAVMPGRVYRNEVISARSHCFFHQMEALYINRHVSFSDLKQTLYHFVREMFNLTNIEIRFRPSFFPFTEPSMEVDITCFLCHKKGCRVCKQTGWVEIAGAGMVHPNVLKNCSIDPKAYTGFAAGMGVERIAMLCYGIEDIRLFSENDIRFLRQFKTVT